MQSKYALVLTPDEIEHIIQAAIRQAMPSFPWGYFSVCPVTRAASALGVEWYGSPIYNLLQVFHCVDRSNIPKSVRKRMPGLIRDLLRGECASEVAELETLYRMEGK